MKMPNKYEIIQAIKRDDGIAFEKQLEGTGCDLERLIELKIETRAAAESIKAGDMFRGGKGEFRYRYPADESDIACTVFIYTCTWCPCLTYGATTKPTWLPASNGSPSLPGDSRQRLSRFRRARGSFY